MRKQTKKAGALTALIAALFTLAASFGWIPEQLGGEALQCAIAAVVESLIGSAPDPEPLPSVLPSSSLSPPGDSPAAPSPNPSDAPKPS